MDPLIVASLILIWLYLFHSLAHSLKWLMLYCWAICLADPNANSLKWTSQFEQINEVNFTWQYFCFFLFEPHSANNAQYYLSPALVRIDGRVWHSVCVHYILHTRIRFCRQQLRLPIVRDWNSCACLFYWIFFPVQNYASTNLLLFLSWNWLR